jgi:glycosyltransferase involved in cell wall biosynthesis
MRAPVSLCLIVKDEPLLEECLKSIRDYVDEIVVVDTGSSGNTPEIAKRYADKFEVYRDCNNQETGLIEDFAQARARSFSLAKNKWVMWCDADDVLVGGEHLAKLVEESNAGQSTYKYLFPYEYAYNDQGVCTLRHYRERLVSDPKVFRWVNPVHEVMIPIDNPGPITEIQSDLVIYKHQRHRSPKQTESGRNLRILRKYVEKHGTSDARQLYYLGIELSNNGLQDEAIETLSKYIEASGWDDERCLACLRIVNIYQARADYKSGVRWALKALESKETWGECYFAVGRMYYFLAQQGGPDTHRNWERSIHFFRLGLGMAPTKTVLFMNPMERELEVYEYLNLALNSVGDVKGALASVDEGLKRHPEAKGLLFNRPLYENFLAVQAVILNTDTLLRNGEISATSAELIKKFVNKQAAAEKREEPKALPTPEIQPPARFENPTPEKLDIVIWTGPSVEWWNPETINKTGLGGSETACIHIAKELAALGHKVKVYSDCPHMEGTFDGVQYIHFGAFANIECDVFLSSRQPSVAEHHIKARAKFLWVHDVHVGGHDPKLHEWMLKFDRFLCLSQWHKDFFLKQYVYLHPDAVLVTRNGIDLSRFGPNPSLDRTNRLIYSSSANRGLDVLLPLMARIRERVSDAELHVYYGFESWKGMTRVTGDQSSLVWVAEMEAKLASTPGVHYHGRVNQKDLATAFLASKVWAYPTYFTETSCISAMEAQAAGCVPVTTKLAALAQTVKHGILLEGDPNSEEYKSVFVDHVCNLLTNEDLRQSYATKGIEHGRTLSWAALAAEWTQLFRRTIDDVAVNITPMFGGERP